MRPPLAVVITTLLGVGAFAAVVVDSVADGCPVTVHARNLGRGAAEVDWAASSTRASSSVLGVRVPEAWRPLGTGTTSVAAGRQVRVTIVVPGTCDADRQYRLATVGGGPTGIEPSPTGWTRATTVDVDVGPATDR
jgi:hypothetical protein